MEKQEVKKRGHSRVLRATTSKGFASKKRFQLFEGNKLEMKIRRKIEKKFIRFVKKGRILFWFQVKFYKIAKWTFPKNASRASPPFLGTFFRKMPYLNKRLIVNDFDGEWREHFFEYIDGKKCLDNGAWMYPILLKFI